LEGDNIGHYGFKKRFTWTWVYFWMVTETEVLESPDLTPFDLYLCGWMNSEFYQKKTPVGIRNELLVRIFFTTTTDTIASQNTDIFSWICTYVRIKSCQPNYFAMNFGWWSSRLVDSSPIKLVLRFYCNSWLHGICIVMYPYDWEKQLVPGSDSNITDYTVHHPRNWRQKINL
jgi:hypothetical protein